MTEMTPAPQTETTEMPETAERRRGRGPTRPHIIAADLADEIEDAGISAFVAGVLRHDDPLAKFGEDGAAADAELVRANKALEEAQTKAEEARARVVGLRKMRPMIARFAELPAIEQRYVRERVYALGMRQIEDATESLLKDGAA